ncbi:RNA polymerase sigma factor [Streptomyces sp. NPDC054802]
MDFREADRRIYEILRADGFQGPRQERLEARLLEYGWRLLMRWLASGEIFARTKAAGRPVRATAQMSELLQTDHAARSDLSSETLLSALPLFREQLASGKWDHERGSLATYYIGTLILSFPNVFRRWSRQRTIDTHTTPIESIPEDASVLYAIDGGEQDPATLVARQDATSRFLEKLRSPDREIARMVYEGRAIHEVAAKYGVTPGAVRKRLHRLRDAAESAGLT